MSYLKDLARACRLKLQRVFLKGSTERQRQQAIDIHKLFLFTGFHEQQQQQLGGTAALPEGFAEHLIEQAKSLAFEQQKQQVEQQLNNQLVRIARSIHGCLQQHQDPMPSATALQQAWQRMHPSQQQQQQHEDSAARRQQHAGSWLAAQSSAAAATGSPGRLLSQQQLSLALQQQLGYSLAVRPSLIPHQEAGMGLFVEGQVPPGALVALFPGLVYNKDVYRRMPNYPRMDRGNPYLTSRYDGGIVDSLPWGRGWLADGQQVVPIVAPHRVGMLGRMAAASDGPRMPIPDTTWVCATTGEAAALELLDGRHPLALAHFANHPPAGASPNTAIASFTFRPAGCTGSKPLSQQQQQQDSLTAAAWGQAQAHTDSGGASVGDASDAQQQDQPWLRSYIPNINYTLKCDPEHLLKHEVSCVGLVAVQALPEGSEVLFNYRLSPSLMGRPAWYTPVDGREEDMRWA